VGRPERAIDPAAGPVEQFACELRKLREEAGGPTYRQLAARSHYSTTVLSRAAGGQELPSLTVALAFVEACGGDPVAWEQRWTRARDARDTAAVNVAALNADVVDIGPVNAAAIGSADSCLTNVPPPRGPRRVLARSRRVLARPRQLLARPRYAVPALVLVLLVGAGGATAVEMQPGAAPSHDPSWTTDNQNGGDIAEPSSPEPMDGDDPRARDCYPDAVTLQSVPIYLPGLKKPFGTLRLRHSAHCGTDWASAYYSNPNLYTITLIAFRPADGAEFRFSWSNNTPPGSYGNMLSTGAGCVWVQATVAAPFGTSRPVRTACLR
jgi:hypothetical protein